LKNHPSFNSKFDHGSFIRPCELKPHDVYNRQLQNFNFWRPLRNVISRIKYTEASPLRLLLHEFKHSGVVRRGEKVLDFGFGNGNAIFWFKPPSEIFGVEISPEAISSASQRAKRKGFKVYNFIKPSGQDSIGIPFPDESFSVIIASHTIEHVYSDETLIKELFRVCRQGGKAFFLVPLDIYDERYFWDRESRLNPDFPLKSFHVFRYNLKTITSLLARSGFRIVRRYAADAIMDFKEKNMWGRLPTRVLFSFIPLRAWFLLDRYLGKSGFHFRQGILVAEK
jgi:ubiquinone/menaquinone biosynthesis C-methylase UbiE